MTPNCPPRCILIRALLPGKLQSDGKLGPKGHLAHAGAGRRPYAASCPKPEVCAQEYETGPGGRQRPKMLKLSGELNGKTEIQPVEPLILSIGLFSKKDHISDRCSR